MVTISPALQDKIERRARRAFSRFDEGSSPRLHRISSLGKDRLNYRVPRSGKKTVEVVRQGREIVVDPPTTGLIDVLKREDFKRLKNNTDKPHAGEITIYLLVDKAKKAGIKDKLDGVSLKRDKDGYYVATHRWRSKSYAKPEDITLRDIKFGESTG